MKNILILSIITSVSLLASSSVTNLDIDQINKSLNSNVNHNTTVRQGDTLLTNANVDNVNILQRSGTNAGNFIESSTLSGTNSSINQGLTSVTDSTLHNAELTSKNEIKRVTVTGGNSNIVQGSLRIGGSSSLIGQATSTGTGFPGGSSGIAADHIKITQTDLLEDTVIENSVIQQGYTTLDNGAIVSNGFVLEQTNTINRLSATGNNDINGSTLMQGIVTINGGTTSDIEQKSENVMEDVTVDGTTVHQSSIILTNSTVSNINNGQNVSNVDDKNRISLLTSQNTSTVEQSVLNVNDSTINNLNNYDRGSATNENNWIYEVTANNATAIQSKIIVKNGSDVQNINYTHQGTASAAINNLYSSSITNSTLKQDETELDNTNFSSSNISRLNIVQNATVDNNSNLTQSQLYAKNSTVDQVNITTYNLAGGLGTTISLDNANISQGSTSITD